MGLRIEWSAKRSALKSLEALTGGLNSEQVDLARFLVQVLSVKSNSAGCIPVLASW